MANTNNRPGNMENVYENRKTLEYGKIISYDDKFKTMIIELSDGSNKVITYSTFKSVWRKKQEALVEAPVEEIVETPVESDETEVEVITEEVPVESVEEVEEAPKAPKAKTKKINLKINEITYDGRTQTIRAWAEELNMPWPTLYDRINRNGWSVEEAIEIPLGGRRKK